MRSIKQTENYWKNPDKKNQPIDYLKGQERTDYLVGIIKKYAEPDYRILELGCNVGRNLYGLWKARFRDLAGIEINIDALRIMKENYPEMQGTVRTFCNPIEDEIIHFNKLDLIYTMAVLCHIHPDVEKVVFDNMVRIARKYIITIENESIKGKRHFIRNYKDVFESRGMQEIFTESCKHVPGIEQYVLRIFKAR